MSLRLAWAGLLVALALPALADPTTRLSTRAIPTSVPTTTEVALPGFLCPSNADLCWHTTADPENTTCEAGIGWELGTGVGYDDATTCDGHVLDGDVADLVILSEFDGGTGTELAHDGTSVYELAATVTIHADDDPDSLLYLTQDWADAVLPGYQVAIDTSSPTNQFQLIDVQGGESTIAFDEQLGTLPRTLRIRRVFDPTDGGMYVRLETAGGSLIEAKRIVDPQWAGDSIVGFDNANCATGAAAGGCRTTWQNVVACNGGCDYPIEPNLLLVLLDDFPRFALSSISTPNLDSLASAGFHTPNLYTSAVCNTSRRMLLEARQLVAPVAQETLVDPDFVHLGELLRRAGYQRRDYIGKLGSYVDSVSPLGFAHGAIVMGFNWYHGDGSTNGFDDDCSSRAGVTWTDACIAEATTLAGGTASGSSEFLWLEQWDHARDRVLAAPPEHLSAWVLASNAIHEPSVDTSGPPWTTPSNCGGSQPEDCIDPETTWTDGQLGELLAAIPNKPNTIVCVLSDNGVWGDDTSLFDAANLAVGDLAKGYVNDEGIRSGLWCAHGGIAAITTPVDVVTLPDLVATVLEAAGYDEAQVTVDDGGSSRVSDGESLWPRLDGSCGTDQCWTSRLRHVLTTSSQLPPEPIHAAVIDKLNPTCKLTCESGDDCFAPTNAHCTGAGTPSACCNASPPHDCNASEDSKVYALPDETATVTAGTCYDLAPSLEKALRPRRKGWMVADGGPCRPEALWCEEFDEANLAGLQAIGYLGTTDDGAGAVVTHTPPSDGMGLRVDGGVFQYWEVDCGDVCRFDALVYFDPSNPAHQTDWISLFDGPSFGVAVRYVNGLNQDQVSLNFGGQGQVVDTGIDLADVSGQWLYLRLEFDGGSYAQIFLDPYSGGELGQGALGHHKHVSGTPAVPSVLIDSVYLASNTAASDRDTVVDWAQAIANAPETPAP